MNAREHLKSADPEGLSLFHIAVDQGQTRICSLLAAEVLCSLNSSRWNSLNNNTTHTILHTFIVTV